MIIASVPRLKSHLSCKSELVLWLLVFGITVTHCPGFRDLPSAVSHNSAQGTHLLEQRNRVPDPDDRLLQGHRAGPGLHGQPW